MDKTERAFKWIVNNFHKHKIPYQLSGGFAARIYGSPRKLRDIDFDIPNDRINELLPETSKFIIFGPDRFVSDVFDVQLLRLNYFGQNVDIAGGSDSKTFDKSMNKWVKDKTDFNRYEIKNIFGLSVPVISPEDYIEYKCRSPKGEYAVDIEAVRKYLKSKK